MTLVQYKLQSAFSVCELRGSSTFWLVGCPFSDNVTRTVEVGDVHNSTTFLSVRVVRVPDLYKLAQSNPKL